MVRVNAVKELTALSRLEEAEGSSAAVEVIRVVMTGTQFQFTSPGVYLGGSIMLRESRHMRKRRHWPQAGWMYSIPYLTRLNALCRFG